MLAGLMLPKSGCTHSVMACDSRARGRDPPPVALLPPPRMPVLLVPPVLPVLPVPPAPPVLLVLLTLLTLLTLFALFAKFDRKFRCALSPEGVLVAPHSKARIKSFPATRSDPSHLY